MRILSFLFLATALAPPIIAAPLPALHLDGPMASFSGSANGDRFGRKVALDGDVAAFIAPNFRDDSTAIYGAVYTSRRDGGVWPPLKRVAIPNPDGRTRYAQSLALSGDTLVVGSYDSTWPGRVDVFVRSGGEFAHQVTLAAPNGSAGYAVGLALSGDDLIVGDQFAERVFVYRRTSGQWASTHQLAPPDAGPHSNFGVSLAIEGDLVAVGRPYFPSFADRRGAVVLYRRTGLGTPFAFEHQHTMQGGGDVVELGFPPIDIDAGRVLAGTVGYEFGSPGVALPGGGAAVALERLAGQWQAEVLLPSDPRAIHDFGHAVALDGPRALVGALDAVTGQPRLYTYAKGAGQWVETDLSVFGAPGDNPIMSISISQGRALAGAPSFSPPPSIPGSAYIFELEERVVPDVALHVDRPSVPQCQSFPAVSSAQWISDGATCRAVRPSAATNHRWSEASCAADPATCPDPLDFRTLPGAGAGGFLPEFVESFGRRSGVLAIECTDANGSSARASALFEVFSPAPSDVCLTPAHAVSPVLSSGPTALPNGQFEMRAAISNPQAATLSAIAFHGQFGTTQARVVGNELVLRYAPDYALVGTQTLLTDNVGAAVGDGEFAVQRGYTISVPLRVYANGFE